MQVTRINRFKAKLGKGANLFDGLKSVAPLIKGSNGCLSCRVLREQDEPERVIVLEEWRDTAAHQAALKTIPASAFQSLMAILAEPPQGAFYKE